MIINIRDKLYDYFLGTGTDGHTDSLYRKTLDLIPNNSRILDVGCGNGTSIINNIDKIKKKNLKIDGIDIDEDYIDSANEKCRNNNAENFVTFTNFKMSLIDESMKWDFVIFSEVYPVIPRDLMSDLMHKAKKLTSRDDGILFIHNLCDHPTKFGQWIKPKTPYFIGADFGRYTSELEFENHLKECGLEIKEKKVLFRLLKKNYPQSWRSKWYYKLLSRLWGTDDDQEWRNNNQWYIRARKVS